MIREFTKGLVRENPVFSLVMGLCPALAVSTQVDNGIGMGASVTFVLLCSNILISAFKDFIPAEVRIPAYIVIIAGFVTIVDLVLQAYAPTLARDLGIFVQLIVVNCVILGRAEAFARRNTVASSAADGLGKGLGFTIALTLIALIREVLGAGTITFFPIGDFDGVLRVPGLEGSPLRVFSLPAGAFLVMGYLMALCGIRGKRRRIEARQ